MSAQKVFLRSGNYRETARYANSDFGGNVEQLLQDLQSQVLVEKEKRRIAEHRADDLEKQLKDLQELTRYELSMEVDRRRDAERRNHDLEQKLRAEAEGRRINAAADEQLLSREQLLLRKGRSTLLPVDRTTSVGGRNLTGMDRVEKGDRGALRRFASLSHPTIRNNISSSSIYNNSHRDDDNDDEEWQFTVRHNERILKNSKRKSTKLTRNRFPEKQHNLQKSASVSTERRNVVTRFAAHHNESQGTRPTAEHVSWRSGSVHERTRSAGQVNSGQSGGGLTHMTEQVSKREGDGNTRGAEHASKGGADAWEAEQTSTKVRASNWSATEKSEDEMRRAASLVDVSKDRSIKEGKRSLRKKVMEAENEDIPKEVHQDSVTTAISQKDATDVTDVLNSSSPSSSHSMKTNIYADPAFKTHHQRTVFWQQVASSIVQQQTEPSRDQSFPVDRTLLSEETASSTTTKLPTQGIMKLKAKCESTPNFSEV